MIPIYRENNELQFAISEMETGIEMKTDENGVINYVNNEYCEISKFGINVVL